ncbi:MAG: glycosyltransferase [Mongoliitalea sp.]
MENYLSNEVDIACIITAYKNIQTSLPLVDSLLKQSYSNYHIYLVADRCEELENLPEDARLTILFPLKPLDSKIKSINLAKSSWVRPHEAVLILDADNLLQGLALRKFSDHFNAGYKAIQGMRTAKNLDTPLACLDALGEIYYNYIQRQVPFQLGSSATIAGSGMLVETSLFETYLKSFDFNSSEVVLAEDKLLQMQLIQSGTKISFQPQALIFDEKTSSGVQLQNQRTRWLKSYFDHLNDVGTLFWNRLKARDWNGIYFACMISTPPLVIMSMLIFIGLFLGFLMSPTLFLLASGSLFLLIGGWILSLAFSKAPVQIWKAIPWIPVFAFRQILSLLGFRQVKNDFLATQHSQTVGIDEVWNERKKDFVDLTS